jgi:hypothetical protein
MGIPRVELERDWLVQNPDDRLGGDIGFVISRYQMTPARSLDAPTPDHRTTRLELWGGSQRSMWLFSSLLVSPETLPRLGTILRTLQSGETPAERISVHLEDNIGFGLMDPYTGYKFKRLFKSIASALEEAIRENAGEVTAVSP